MRQQIQSALFGGFSRNARQCSNNGLRCSSILSLYLIDASLDAFTTRYTRNLPTTRKVQPSINAADCTVCSNVLLANLALGCIMTWSPTKCTEYLSSTSHAIFRFHGSTSRRRHWWYRQLSRQLVCGHIREQIPTSVNPFML